jgi:hypothetical protein
VTVPDSYRVSLRKLAEQLMKENHPIGPELLDYADAWDKEVARTTRKAPKRYDIYGQDNYGECCTEVDEDANGKWVKWEDVSSLFATSDEGTNE